MAQAKKSGIFDTTKKNKHQIPKCDYILTVS